jgi:hypothetical protein
VLRIHGHAPFPRRRYALSPLAEWMVRHFIPLWMAPNLITLLGLLCPVASLLVFTYFSPGLTADPEPPRWTYVLNALALFAYQTLDNMDGKQVCVRGGVGGRIRLPAVGSRCIGGGALERDQAARRT